MIDYGAPDLRRSNAKVAGCIADRAADDAGRTNASRAEQASGTDAEASLCCAS